MKNRRAARVLRLDQDPLERRLVEIPYQGLATPCARGGIAMMYAVKQDMICLRRGLASLTQGWVVVGDEAQDGMFSKPAPLGQ